MPVIDGAYCTTRNLGIDGIVYAIDPRPVPRPPSPTSLELEAGDGFINVSWEPIAVENYVVIDYVIYMGNSRDDMAEVGRSGRSNVFNVTGLTNGKTYFFTVAAVNSAGIGVKADPKSATPMGLPSEPRDVVGTSGDGTVVLNWSYPLKDGGGLLGYKVLRGTSPTNPEHIATLDAGHTFTDDDEGLTMGETYYYAVIAFNQVGDGELSEVAPVIVYAPPTVPLDLYADPGDSIVNLSWSPPEGIGAKRLLIYRIFRGTTRDDLVHLNDVVGSETRYSDDDGLVNGRTYWYAVYATNEYVGGDLCEPVSVTPVGTPSEPKDLAAAAGDGKVMLSWSEPKTDGGLEITSYLVFGGRTPNDLQVVVELGNITFDTITGLENAVTYYFQVTAVNARGEGKGSSTVEATPLLTPETPGGFNATATRDGILLSWEEVLNIELTGPVTYLLMRGTGDGPLGPIATLSNTTSYLDESVTRGTVYSYQVHATNKNEDESPPTAILSVPMPDVPGRVGDLLTEGGDGEVVLTWSSPSQDGGSEILRYHIYRGPSDSDMVLLDTVTPTDDYIDKDVVNGMTYHYHIVAENMMGNGLPSNTVKATPQEVVLPTPPNGDNKDGIPLFVWLVIALALVIAVLLFVLMRRRKG
jgi:titin